MYVLVLSDGTWYTSKGLQGWTENGPEQGSMPQWMQESMAVLLAADRNSAGGTTIEGVGIYFGVYEHAGEQRFSLVEPGECDGKK